jgi:feruloyl-CoA synthase
MNNDCPQAGRTLFVDPAVILEARPDGTRLFRSKLELPGFARCSGEWLERWASRNAGHGPDRRARARTANG